MKYVCIYHSVDLDGWMSAAIVKKWFNDKEQAKENLARDGVQGIPIDTIDFIGYNYGQPIPDLSDYDKVIMCDISFPKNEMDFLEHKLIWIDHHISAINSIGHSIKGLRKTAYAACELTWDFFFHTETMPEIVRLLGRYDCFGHKGTDEEQKVLEFQYGARQKISNHEEAYTTLIKTIEDSTYNTVIQQHGKAVYSYLCTEAMQAYKNGFKINLVEEITDERGKNIVNRKFLCINKDRFNPVNFGIDYHKDGYDGVACFWFNGITWAFSLYNDNGLVDCSVIAKEFGGGGHKGASGFMLSVGDKIDSFLNPRKV